MRLKSHLLLAAALAATAFTQPTHAATLLPAASYFGETEVTCSPCSSSYHGSTTNPGTKHSQISSASTGVEYLDNFLSLNATPSIDAKTESDSTKDSRLTFTAGADGTISYYMEITGPEATVVPVSVYSFAFVTANNLGSASASLSIEGSGVDIRKSINTKGLSSYGSFSVRSKYDFESNTLYKVEMSASTAADGLLYFPEEGYAEAYVDPRFAVDPKYAGDYTLEFSSGIENRVSLVPLPAAAPMFGVALITLGGVGCGLKRRKAAAAV